MSAADQTQPTPDEAKAAAKAAVAEAAEKRAAEFRAAAAGMRVSIDPKALLMVAPFVATRDIRYYLHGFLVERAPQGGAYIVGTNGNAMGVFYDSVTTFTGGLDRVLLRSSPDLLRACKAAKRSIVGKMRVILKGKRLSVAPGFDDGDDDKEAFVLPGNAHMSNDGSCPFPQWARVLPDFARLTLGHEETLKSSLLQLVHKSATVCSGSRSHNGLTFWSAAKDGVVAVQYCDEPRMLGLVMPMRDRMQEADALKLMEPFALAKKRSTASA